MSTPETGKKQQPEKPDKKGIGAQDALTLVATQLEELRAEITKQGKNVNLLAEAIVKINEKVEAKPAAAGEGSDAVSRVLATIVGQQQGTSLDGFARQAESFAKAADALERFRNPYRLGAGEAMLMRLGLRAAFPRYMTKAELQKAERALGVLGAFEEEGETEHVSE